MNTIGKIAVLGIFLTSGAFNVAHAQVIQQTVSSSISSTLKNAVNTAKENAFQNGITRNQLVADQSAELQNKEKDLVDLLNSNLSDLENIQTRIATKTAETAASGTDTTLVNAWLASSSDDILTAQNDISTFASSTTSDSNGSNNKISIVRARNLADVAIDSVNMAHDDLQSALDALTSIL